MSILFHGLASDAYYYHQLDSPPGAKASAKPREKVEKKPPIKKDTTGRKKRPAVKAPFRRRQEIIKPFPVALRGIAGMLDTASLKMDDPAASSTDATTTTTDQWTASIPSTEISLEVRVQ